MENAPTISVSAAPSIVDDKLSSSSSRPNRNRKNKAPVANYVIDPALGVEEEQATKKRKRNPSVGKPPDVQKVKKSAYGEVSAVDAIQMSIYSQNKRPRGRPPLITNKSKIMTKQMQTSFRSVPQFLPVDKIVNPPKTLVQNFAPHAENTKTQRPPASLVTQRVLAKIMTSDPLSTAELAKQLPDCPRDLIQAVLDILQVMGIVEQLKVKEIQSAAEGPAIGSSVYSLVGFSKGFSSIQLAEIEQDITSKLQQYAEAQSRISDLLELTKSPTMSPQDRLLSLKNLITKFLQKNPALWDDPLYRAIIEHTGNSHPNAHKF